MMLGELIKALEAEPDQGKVLPLGFGDPDSYRGYHDLMFVPKADVTVGHMLADVRSALGTTYQGWKGGDYKMSEHTDCWLAYCGHGDGETIGPVLLTLLLSAAEMGDGAQVALRKFAGPYGPGDFK